MDVAGMIWEWAWRIVQEEERELVRRVMEGAERVREALKFPHPVDDFVWLDDYWMGRGEKFTVFDLSGVGKVEEVVVKSASKNFKLTFTKDERRKELTYDKIEVQTQVSGSYYALQDGGEYVVGLKDHAFLTRCKLVLEAGEDMVFTRIYAKWNLIKWIGFGEE